jgi:hypothetical protein
MKYKNATLGFLAILVLQWAFILWRDVGWTATAIMLVAATAVGAVVWKTMSLDEWPFNEWWSLQVINLLVLVTGLLMTSHTGSNPRMCLLGCA